MTTKYPNSERLSEVKKESQIIGQFLDSYLSKNHYVIAEWGEPMDIGKYDVEALYTVRKSKEEMLAEYFGIDLEELENERRQMIEELQNG